MHHRETTLSARTALLAGALSLLLAGAAFAQSNPVDTPAERGAPAPVAPEEPPAQPREVLVRAQPDGPRPPVKQRLRVGPNLELYLPTSAKTRDRYGSSWFGLGVGLGSVRQEGLLGTLSGEVYLLHNKDNGHEAYIIPLGVAYRRALLDRVDVRPYAGASVNLVLGNFNSPTDGIPWGLRAAGGGSALAGVTFGQAGYVEARYLLTSKMRGMDFSGLNLTAGIRF